MCDYLPQFFLRLHMRPSAPPAVFIAVLRSIMACTFLTVLPSARAVLSFGISTQPTGVSVAPGQLASFSVTTSNAAGAVTYQWRKNDSPIGGATSATLNITSAQPADSGSYSVIAFDTVDSVKSNVVTLAVSSDSFAGRGSLVGTNTTSLASNATAPTTLATKEAGELNHAGNAG